MTQRPNMTPYKSRKRDPRIGMTMPSCAAAPTLAGRAAGDSVGHDTGAGGIVLPAQDATVGAGEVTGKVEVLERQRHAGSNIAWWQQGRR